MGKTLRGEGHPLGQWEGVRREGSQLLFRFDIPGGNGSFVVARHDMFSVVRETCHKRFVGHGDNRTDQPALGRPEVDGSISPCSDEASVGREVDIGQPTRLSVPILHLLA